MKGVQSTLGEFDTSLYTKVGDLTNQSLLKIHPTGHMFKPI